jgi:hypothetical protein
MKILLALQIGNARKFISKDLVVGCGWRKAQKFKK